MWKSGTLWVALLTFGCSADHGAIDTDTDAVEEPGPAVCCGCTCVDEAWSCTAETCIDANGLAVDVRPEAGFYELPAAEVMWQGTPTSTSTARMWYAFQPAREAPESAPLVVFVNGGPGAATSSGLMSMNIGERAVDTESSPPAVVDNPWAWTEFANLLFVDARGTGFSYEIGASPTSNVDQDAADILRVALRFMSTHPLVRAQRVVFVGESYGGLRVAAIANLIWGQDELATGLAPDQFVDGALSDELAQFERERFQDFVSVQGSLLEPSLREPTDAPPCPPESNYACSFPPRDLERRFDACAEVVSDPASLSALLGVDITTIEWMYAEHRHTEAPRDSDQSPVSQGPMRDVFGPLLSGRKYFARFVVKYVEGGFQNRGDRLFAQLPHTRWLLTNAHQDQVVYIPALLDGFARALVEWNFEGLVEVVGDEVRFILPDETYVMRVRDYPDSGHAVSAYAPEAIHDDVRDWLDL